MRIVLVVVAVLVVAAGLELVLEAARHSAAVVTGTVAVSARPSATATPTSTYGSSPTPSPTSHVPTPPPPPPPTVTVAGAGSGNSRVFSLNDTIGYLARYTLGPSCQYDGYLVSTDGTYTNTDSITDTGPTSATKILNNMPIGNYYVAMTTGRGCSWSVTFTPR
jgi:hypothetical protein